MSGDLTPSLCCELQTGSVGLECAALSGQRSHRIASVHAWFLAPHPPIAHQSRTPSCPRGRVGGSHACQSRSDTERACVWPPHLPERNSQEDMVHRDDRAPAQGKRGSEPTSWGCRQVAVECCHHVGAPRSSVRVHVPRKPGGYDEGLTWGAWNTADSCGHERELFVGAQKGCLIHAADSMTRREGRLA